MLNVLNGGAHADNNVDVQEFMIVPYGMKSFAEALARRGGDFSDAQESFARPRRSRPASATRAALRRGSKATPKRSSCCSEAITQAGYKAGSQVALALDVASSEFYDDGRYVFKKSDGRKAAIETKWSASTKTGCGNIRSSPSRMVLPKTTGKAGA